MRHLDLARRFAGVAAGLVLFAAGVCAEERILAWESDIRVRPDSTLEVRETLRVRAEGVGIRRGIFRDFPTVYTDSRGERMVTGFDVEGVTRNGRAEPWRLEKRANGVRIWIGDPADRNKGLGAAMMRAVIGVCFSDPAVTAIVIDPLSSNADAHRFYQRLGFKVVGPRMFGEDDCLVHRLDRSDWEQLHG